MNFTEKFKINFLNLLTMFAFKNLSQMKGFLQNIIAEYPLAQEILLDFLLLIFLALTMCIFCNNINTK